MSEIVEVTNIKEYVDEILINEDNNSNQTYSLIESQINELDTHHKYIKKIIKVKDSKKMEILNQLKLFNISEKTLFYDNIDKNCEIIKNGNLRG